MPKLEYVTWKQISYFMKMETENTQDAQEQMEGFIKNREDKGLADQSARKDALSKIDQKIKHMT